MVSLSRRAVLRAGIAGGAAALGLAPSAASAAAADINPVATGEEPAVINLRKALNNAARGEGPVRDGRVVVTAPAGTHVLTRPLVIGGSTHLDASAATFYANFETQELVLEAGDLDTLTTHDPKWDLSKSDYRTRAVKSGLRATMLINHVESGTGGYNAQGNILISGGAWDPSWYYVKKYYNSTVPSEIDAFLRATPAPAMNVITIEHTTEVTIEDVVVRNVKWWHAVELNAVQNAVVRNCEFRGWIEDPTKPLWHGEAVQLDLAGSGNTWGGLRDNTPCKGVRVQNNYCGLSGSRPGWGRFIGSHTAKAGFVHSDVKIEFNTVERTKWDAIAPTNTQKVRVANNTVTDCAGGVYVKASPENPITTVDVVDNTVSIIAGSGRPALGIAADAPSWVADAEAHGNIVPENGPFWYGGNVQARNTLQGRP
ncbi:right-handed parallel beta-helix repeat-containing protein [Actinoplanes regularis]|uniref:right-handed parallel beta-helix repeat-containing protein n=1 Tax=Actinoplanes regularis TaxID=52697 RepID=UPI0024A28861|nr:right-handed parallel beta-helix repeat-containing protein [Actinoplanes regularis]GLW35079.1 hypothetical protein Areg01_80150 [Actinoplanes regularis]